ncbi:hypothetical protein BH23ACT9_BH23ACT9_17390 [soil metagenome]
MPNRAVPRLLSLHHPLPLDDEPLGVVEFVVGDVGRDEGLASELSLAGEITRLDGLRMSATEHLLAAEIAIGRHSVVVAELEALTDRYALRERLWAQLMLALYRTGRQADALAAYKRVRALLKEQLGINPSPELQELHLRILQQDPDLHAARPPTAPGRSPTIGSRVSSDRAGWAWSTWPSMSVSGARSR